MDIIVAKDLLIKCNNCGRRYSISKNSLDPQIWCNNGRGMGDEYEYHFLGEMSCYCGNLMKYDIQAWEYPVGSINYTNEESIGCFFVQRPVVEADYSRDYLEFQYDQYEENRILDDVEVAYINMERVLMNPDNVYDLTSREFEYMVAQIFEEQGYTVKVTPSTHDGGADIIAMKNIGGLDYMILIECKKYSLTNKVGVGLVRSLRGVQADRKANKAVLVTSSTFTRGAKSFAENQQNLISLVDINELIQMIRDLKS